MYDSAWILELWYLIDEISIMCVKYDINECLGMKKHGPSLSNSILNLWRTQKNSL